MLIDHEVLGNGNGFTISVQLGLHTHRISCVVASIVTYNAWMSLLPHNKCFRLCTISKTLIMDRRE